MSTLHVETRGSGMPLILLHGWGLNLRVWDGLAGELAGRCRLIAIDLPGHGRSPWCAQARDLAGQARLVWSTIARLASRTGQPALPCAVLGWSLGGQVALELAASAPERCSALVLIATTPRFAAAPDWPHGLHTALLAGFAARLGDDYRRTVREFLELQVRGGAHGAHTLRELQTALFAHGEAHPAALAAGLELLGSTDLRAGLGRIGQPALVIAGENDRVTPPGASRELTAALPHARLLELRRAGHAPFLSHGARTAQAIGEFLDDIGARRPAHGRTAP